jgi:hypothetical protein
MTALAVHPEFLDDIKRILGDHTRRLRTPPSRPEDDAIQQLLVRVFGTEREPPAKLGGRFAGSVHVPSGKPLTLTYIDWGGYYGQWLPPVWIPRCRIWMAERGSEEWLLALCGVDDVPEDTFPEVNQVVAERVRDLHGTAAYVELKASP